MPDVVDSNPVEAEASTCMRRGGSLRAGQFAYVAPRWSGIAEVITGRVNMVQESHIFMEVEVRL